MRSFIHAICLSGLLISIGGLASSASAADLDEYYEPAPVPPAPVLPPPPPPCGVYRPCPLPRFGYVEPRPYRFYGPPVVAYEKPAYAPIAREGYGYDYDRGRFERAHRHFERYGYVRPRDDPYEPRTYERRERLERYGDGRPYADPLGHERFERRHEEHFGYDRRDEDRFDRGPDRG